MGLINIISNTISRLHALPYGQTASSADVSAELDQSVNNDNSILQDLNNLNEALDNVVGVDWQGDSLADISAETTSAISLANQAVSVGNENTQNLENHRLGYDHDTRYYTRSQSDLEFVHKSELVSDTSISVFEEVFEIVNPDLGDGTFSYIDSDSVTHIGDRSGSYLVFELQQGEYTMGNNRASAIVGDTLRRSVASGGLLEVDSTHVGVTEEIGGTEITIVYFSITGSMGSSIVVSATPPSNPYSGQVWIDIS